MQGRSAIGEDASGDTRTRVLEAALACFNEHGYEQTTIARICERSGASNGALFHRFASKEAIADALYVRAIASFQEGLWDLLRRRPRSLRAAVRGTISHQLDWIENHRDEARFLYMRGHLDWDSPAGAEVVVLNRNLGEAYREWMAPLVAAGTVKPMSMLMITAIVNGPAHAIARRWLAGHVGSPLHGHLDELADAACAALGGASASPRRTPSTRSRHAAGEPSATSQIAAMIPFATLVGLELLEATPQVVRGRLAWSPERCTTGEIMHGGALMTLADTCAAVCAFLNLPGGALGTATIESKTNFLRAVREGAVTAAARPLHAGRTLIVLETEIVREDGSLAAKVSQTQAFHYPRS
jgi:uncharacterized protein (TIGR00369 family)